MKINKTKIINPLTKPFGVGVKQSGTALLVTLLLTGAISAIAFGMTKITLNEVFVGMKSQEGLGAQYAAQAGVEDALMRYKFHDKTSLEMPNEARGGVNNPTNNVVRVYLNRPSVARVNPMTNRPSANDDDYYYDLKVWHKKDCLADTCEYKLKKDESVLLDTSDITDKIDVTWSLHKANGQFIPGASLTEYQRPRTALWYRLSDPANQNQIDPSEQNRDFFTILSYYSNPAGYEAKYPFWPINPGGPPKPLSIKTAKSLKFKAFLPDTFSDAYIKITITSGVVGGPTHIESTGYYGNTAKKIEVTVDRESKSIIDIFDYVIYSGSGPLPGQQ